MIKLKHDKKLIDYLDLLIFYHAQYEIRKYGGYYDTLYSKK